MQIIFNEEPMQCADEFTVAALLKHLNQLKIGTALAINQKILPRNQWEVQKLNNGDRIMLFKVIAGG